jgi:hypothetical protein
LYRGPTDRAALDALFAKPQQRCRDRSAQYEAAGAQKIVGASLAHQIAFNRTWYGRAEASLGISGQVIVRRADVVPGSVLRSSI